MSLSSVENKVQYIGNGSTTLFPFPYRFIEDNHLVVTLTNINTGENILQVQGLNYSVIGANSSSGGSVTFFTAPSSVFRVTIERQVPITQLVDYQPDDDFPAEVHESALDKLTMIDQQLSSRLGRTLNAPATDIVALNPLPNAAARANKTLVFDSTGQPAASQDNYVNNVAQSAANAAAAANSATSAANSAATAANTVGNFQKRYVGGLPNDPTVDGLGNPLTAGAIYFNTSLNQIRIYNGTSWIQAIAPTSNLSARRFTYFASTTTQSSISGNDINGNSLVYDPPQVDVFVNGVKLPQGYITATTGNSITFNSAITFTPGDWIEVVAYTVLSIVEVANNTITTPKISGGAVTTDKLDAAAVTPEKLANSGVTAGTYLSANITVNSKGQITLASSGATTVTSVALFDSNHEKGERGHYAGEEVSYFVDNQNRFRWAGPWYWQKGAGSVLNATQSGGAFAYSSIMWADPVNEKIVKFWCGPRESYLLTNLGNLYHAGYNYTGRGGVNNGNVNYVFTRIPIPDQTTDPVVDFSTSQGVAYEGHSGCVTQSGKLYMWGNGSNFALGTGNQTQQNAPVRVNFGAIIGKQIKKVFCCGGGNAIWTLVTDIDDNVYSCGYNNNGQCGLGGTGGTVNNFTLIQTTNTAKADRIFGCGGNNSYVGGHSFILRNGVLFGAGYGAEYSLGQLDGVDRGSFVPVQNMAGKTVIDLAISGTYANAGCSAWALCTDGTIMSWGRDGQGQLGRGSVVTSRTPGQMLAATDGQAVFTKIKASGGSPNSGTVSMMALGSNGRLYSVGFGGYYNFGNASSANSSRLIPVLFSEEPIVDFTYGQGNGYYNCMAKGSSGKLYVWGANQGFRCGLPFNDASAANGYVSIPTIAQIAL